MTACVFCEIADSPEHEWWEWYGVRAVIIDPQNPVTPGHKLVIPELHVRDAAHVLYLSAAVMAIAGMYMKRHPVEYNLITSIGPSATQTVFHLHLHIVPRRPDDGLHLPWTGQLRDTEETK